MTDNFCIRYRERKYNSAIGFLKRNNTTIIKSKHLYVKTISGENNMENNKSDIRSPIKEKTNLTNALNNLISSKITF